MSLKLITPEDAEQVLQDVLGIKPLDALVIDGEMAIAKVLLFSAYVGEERDQLSIVSGVPLDSVARISEVLQKNGVFGVGANHEEEYLGNGDTGLQLTLDLACGKDLLRRVAKDGQTRYQNTEKGMRRAEELLRKRGRK